MNRFIVGLLVKGQASDLHQKLVKEVSEKFGIFAIQTPSHITLKDNIYTDNILPVKELIKDFVKNTNFSGAEVEIGGIGNFRQRVYFIDVKLNAKARKIYLELFKKLKQIAWLQWDEFDSPDRNFHLTITLRAEPEQIVEIENFLNQFSEEKFNIPFNNIAILKKLEDAEDRRWIVEKEFTTQPQT